MHTQNSVHKTRFNTLMSQPKKIKFKLAVVQFSLPGAKNDGLDKGPDGNRADSIPIANGSFFNSLVCFSSAVFCRKANLPPRPVLSQA